MSYNKEGYYDESHLSAQAAIVIINQRQPLGI